MFSVKGGFLNEYGVCPFDTVNALDDNPYAGHHDIVWNDVEFPVTGNYNIEVDVDDACNLYFDNFVDEQQSIRKLGFVPNTNTALVKALKLYFLIKVSIEFLLTFIKNQVEDFLLILPVEPKVVN